MYRVCLEIARNQVDIYLSYDGNTGVESFLANAATEGLNRKIQFIKDCARGFRNSDNYRISMLFFHGKFNMAPAQPGH